MKNSSNQYKRFAITGIGTEVGKTVVSSILAEALQASYWKPIQAGDLVNSDSKTVDSLTSSTKILPEAFRLSEPMSPHAAAEIDGVEIALEDLSLPAVNDNLIIEGAGGIMVPLNNKGLTFLDLIESWNIPTIIVSRHYLGSINHSLLTAEVLKNSGTDTLGFIFVGSKNQASEQVILKNSGLPMLGRIPLTDNIDKKFIAQQASIIKLRL